MSYSDYVLDFLNAATKLNMTMPLIEGKTFTDEIVLVDFKRYKKCVFTNCTIIIKYGLFSMVDNELHSCKIEAITGSPAFNVLSFDRALKQSVKDDNVLGDNL